MAEDLVLTTLRGGQNDSDPITLLEQDEVVSAVNVEFFSSALGERRGGTETVTITSSGLSDEDIVVHLSQWFPDNSILTPEWWAVAATPATSVTISKRNSALVWAEQTPTQAIGVAAPEVYSIVSQALNGKLFWAYKSAYDRLHVWDGTNLRPTGITAPAAAPTGANEGVGAYATIRYFRVRFVKKSGSTVLLRSEPSSTLSFTPSGAGAGITVTRPALVSEGETHWELEASTDNANFYLLTTVVTGTTTYNDETAYVTGYAGGTVSDAIGSYLLQVSARYLCVDGDRLLLGGHWSDATMQSTVSWSPVFNDPGKGNDERAPIVTTGGANITTSAPLDNYAGGPITGMGTAGVGGSWYVFKWNHIYKMVRTDDNTRAYTPLTMSSTRGAIDGSVFAGVDENGAGCVYFLDPMLGPSRIGPAGLQSIKGLWATWARVNLKASKVIARGTFYPYKQQAKWVISVDGGNSPELGLTLQCTEVRQAEGGIRGGWSLFTGLKAEAYSIAALSELATVDGQFALSTRPFIGLADPDFIQRCDVGEDDNGTEFVASIVTRPYLLSGLLAKWGARVASILATANDTGSMVVRLIRDFGKENSEVLTDLAPEGDETYVIKDFDDLVMSEARVIQIEFADQ